MKEKYLNDLKRSLDDAKLSESEMNSIIESTDIIFKDNLLIGKSEAETISELGNTQTFAAKYIKKVVDITTKSEEYYPKQNYKINVNLGNVHLTIKTHSLDTIIVDKSDIRENCRCYCEFSNNDLKIYEKKKVLTIFKPKENRVKITVPEHLEILFFNYKNINSSLVIENDLRVKYFKVRVINGDYSSYKKIYSDEITISNINGNIAGSLECSICKVRGVNGNTVLSNSNTARDLEIATVNGKIDIDNLKCNTLKISGINANGVVKNSTINILSLSTVNGKVNLVSNDIKENRNGG